MSDLFTSWTLFWFVTANLLTLLLSIVFFFIERRKSDNLGDRDAY